MVVRVVNEVYFNVYVEIPLYIASEVIQSKPYSFTIDIWSVRVTIYEIITKELLFKTIINSFNSILQTIHHTLINSDKIKQIFFLLLNPQIKQLLTQILQMEPEKQISVKQVLMLLKTTNVI